LPRIQGVVDGPSNRLMHHVITGLDPIAVRRTASLRSPMDLA
jgi:hypothetical protein